MGSSRARQPFLPARPALPPRRAAHPCRWDCPTSPAPSAALSPSSAASSRAVATTMASRSARRDTRRRPLLLRASRRSPSPWPPLASLRRGCRASPKAMHVRASMARSRPLTRIWRPARRTRLPSRPPSSWRPRCCTSAAPSQRCAPTCSSTCSRPSCPTRRCAASWRTTCSRTAPSTTPFGCWSSCARRSPPPSRTATPTSPSRASTGCVPRTRRPPTTSAPRWRAWSPTWPR
mmetsp:Transcript_23485/g.54326  ORF Transcript_23485/g.54326 Transcript_23485/m.54326 type:complete len:234 (-) Transcript_23485:1033-1734(-)